MCCLALGRLSASALLKDLARDYGVYCSWTVCDLIHVRSSGLFSVPPTSTTSQSDFLEHEREPIVLVFANMQICE